MCGFHIGLLYQILTVLHSDRGGAIDRQIQGVEHFWE